MYFEQKMVIIIFEQHNGRNICYCFPFHGAGNKCLEEQLPLLCSLFYNPFAFLGQRAEIKSSVVTA